MPIFKYYAQLDGGEKSDLLMNRLNPINQQALDFNRFLRRMVPLKKDGVEESFEELFAKIKQKLYPS